MQPVPYERYVAWRRAMTLVARVYRLTRCFPAEERPGLSATMRRTATTVPAMIADAQGRIDPREAVKAYSSAQAALRELVTHLLVARRLGFISFFSQGSFRRRCQRLNKMLEDAVDRAAAASRGVNAANKHQANERTVL